jgi:hypothetical protein
MSHPNSTFALWVEEVGSFETFVGTHHNTRESHLIMPEFETQQKYLSVRSFFFVYKYKIFVSLLSTILFETYHRLMNI